MENSLLNYMNKRFGHIQHKNHPKTLVAGPVITISRQVGCSGIATSEKLAEVLNEFTVCKKWEVISKEVLQQSAQNLQLDHQKVKRLFIPNERNSFDEILEAFNAKMYKSDRVILKTVKEVIKGFAVEGCCIIVGRAAHIIARDIEHSLHVKLEAPLDWRIPQIASKMHMTPTEALKYIQETEKKRDTFRKHYLDKKHPEEEFDLVINVSRFNTDAVIQIIKSAVELKGITEVFKSGASYF